MQVQEHLGAVALRRICDYSAWAASPMTSRITPAMMMTRPGFMHQTCTMNSGMPLFSTKEPAETWVCAGCTPQTHDAAHGAAS